MYIKTIENIVHRFWHFWCYYQILRKSKFYSSTWFVPWELVLLLKYVIFETKAALSKFKKIEENMIKIIYFAIKHDRQTNYLFFSPPHGYIFLYNYTHLHKHINKHKPYKYRYKQMNITIINNWLWISACVLFLAIYMYFDYKI